MDVRERKSEEERKAETGGKEGKESDKNRMLG